MVNTLTIRFDTVTMKQSELVKLVRRLGLHVTIMEYHEKGTPREHTHCIVQGDYRKDPDDLKKYLNRHRKHQPGVNQQYAGRHGLDVEVVRDIPAMEDYILKEKKEALLKSIGISEK